MSNFSSSQYYPAYKYYLTQYSACIKPVLEAAHERMFVRGDLLVYELDEYCVGQKDYVEKYRNLIKQELSSDTNKDESK
jgi:hypothetical protein